MSHEPAPLDLEVVLSPEWLGDVLGAPVARTTVVESLTTIASKVRFQVEYGPGAPAGLPTALCVKGYFAPESANFVSLGQFEVRFYRDFAPTFPIERPPCVYADIDETTGHGLILMHDLVAAGCTFLTALSPYTPDQVAATLTELAGLHHADPARSAGGAAWLAPRLAGYVAYVDEARLQGQLDDGRAAAFSREVADAARLRAAFTVIAERASARPECVIHGDAHAGNLYLTPQGSPGLIDWQVLQLGPWALDVAYHITSVLEVDDRARNERTLLAHYLDVRRSLGDDVPDFDTAWDEYRDAMVYGYYMWAVTQRVERPIIETFVTRLGTAVETHESLDRVGA